MRFTRKQMDEAKRAGFQEAFERYYPIRRSFALFVFSVGLFAGLFVHLFISVIAKGASTWPIL